MKTIHKYPLAVVDSQHVLLPLGAEILSAQFQGIQLCLWALVDTDQPLRARSIVLLETGNAIPPVLADNLSKKNFIGTVQEPNYPMVWHIFA